LGQGDFRACFPSARAASSRPELACARSTCHESSMLSNSSIHRTLEPQSPFALIHPQLAACHTRIHDKRTPDSVDSQSCEMQLARQSNHIRRTRTMSCRHRAIRCENKRVPGADCCGPCQCTMNHRCSPNAMRSSATFAPSARQTLKRASIVRLRFFSLVSLAFLYGHSESLHEHPDQANTT
jgi:hypothetical protein